MNTNTQIVDDLHVIAAPIRFAGNLIVRLITITLFIALYPLILAWLLYSNHIEHIHAAAAPYYYPPTEDGLYKIVICVLGPFAFVVWFSLLARWAEMRRHGGLWQEKEAGFDPTRGNNLRSCLGWLFSVLGACGALMFCSYNWIEGEPTVWAAAIGHLLPAIVYVPYRILRNLEEGAYAKPPVEKPEETKGATISVKELNRLAAQWEAYQRGEAKLTPKEQAYMESCTGNFHPAQRAV